MVTRAPRRRLAVLAAACAAALIVTGCQVATDDPLPPRPYLVGVDRPDDVPVGEVVGTLTVRERCVLLETDAGTVFPLFAERAAFGPRDGGGRVTVDVAGQRLYLGDEVVLRGDVRPVTDGVRATYPGVDFTRCPADAFAILGAVVEVTDGPNR